MHNIKLVVSDFDGVFTDDKVYTFDDGSEAVLCTKKDGWGVEKIRSLGLEFIVLTSERNQCVVERCNKLSIKCIQVKDGSKLDYLKKYLDRRNISPEETIFVGNDLNDIECMKFARVGVCVYDAHYRVLEITNVILKKNGGEGAIRELSEMIEQMKIQ